MTYFSRLTDIVTCNLTRILEAESDPQSAVQEIIAEMREGLAGAERCMTTAAAAVDRLSTELDEHQQQVTHWADQAKQELSQSNEEKARLALFRKREVEDLIAGLEQQLEAAKATRDHLTTTQRALEARLADALRKQQQLADGDLAESVAVNEITAEPVSTALDTRSAEIEDELAALKRELEGNGS